MAFQSSRFFGGRNLTQTAAVFGGLLVGVFLNVQVGAAQDADAPRIARLIHQLGSEEFSERAAANEALAKVGEAGAPQLTAALTSDDAEVRLRAQNLLRKLQESQMWGASPVELAAGERKISQILDDLADQSGTRIHLPETAEGFRDLVVALDAHDSTFWPAIDRLCAQSQNSLRPQYHPYRAGLMIVAGGPGKFPVAYAGPVRAQLTSARRVFTEQLDYETAKSEVSHTFQMGLEIMWEDRFRLMAYQSQPEVVRAVTDQGDELPGVGASGGWNVATPATRQVSATLRLNPAPRAARRFAELHLRWEMIAVGDMAAWEIDDLAENVTHQHDDLELTVESVEERPGARIVLSLVVARDLAAPNPQEVLLHENEVELLTAAGQAFSCSSRTQSLTERGARLRLTFHAPSEGSRPDRLRITYPRVRSQRALEIVFRDVPLPAAQPD